MRSGIYILYLCCGGVWGYGDLKGDEVFEMVPVHKPNVGSDGTYTWVFTIAIKSKPMLCLDLVGGQAKNGNTLEIWECNGLENQLWYFTEGTWEIAYGGDKSKCIDAGSSMQKGNTLMLWDCNQQKQQKWGYDPNAGTIFLSESEGDASLCMDLAGASTNLGTPIQTWDCAGTWGQQWSIITGITIRVGQNTKLCVDAAGGKTDNGTPVQIWNCNGLNTQYWVFASGTNVITSGADTSKCIDAGDQKPGNGLMLWDCNGMDQQSFGYDPRMGTIFLSKSSADASLCIDFPGGSDTPGTQLEVWGCNGCWNQDLILYGPADSTKALIGGTHHHNYTSAFDEHHYHHYPGQPSLGSSLRVAGTPCPPQPTPGPTPGPPGPGPPSPPPPGPGPSQMMDYCKFPQASSGSWPTFQNQAALQADAKWSKYFTGVYGGIPTSGYPICTGGFYYAYHDLMSSAGISTSSLISKSQEFGGHIYELKHSKPVAFDSNKWVEGAHCRTGGEVHSAWYWHMPGSGIWIWSGKTDVFQHRTEAVKKYLGNVHCSGFECGGKLFTTAKSKFGIDTVQYLAETDGNTHMWIVCMGHGHYTCGDSPCAWKAGWGGSQACNCDQNARCQNCKGFGVNSKLALLSNSTDPCVV